jgi:hypothetical protein
MNREAIRLQARDWLDDTVQPYLYTDAALNAYGDEGQREAVIRSRLLVDSTTPQWTQIAVVAGQVLYPLDDVVIVVRRASFASADGSSVWPLDRLTYDTLDQHRGYDFYRRSNWEIETGPRPRAIIQDLETRQFRLYPIPNATGTLRLTVLRWPSSEECLDSDGEEPIIPEHFHRALAHWICHRAFLKKDAETFDPGASDRHLSLFESAVGKRPSLKELKTMATDRFGETTSYQL